MKWESSFEMAAGQLSIPAFRIYLAHQLVSQYWPEENPEAEDARWLVLHLLVQAGRGHLRTDLQNLKADMEDWISPSDSTNPHPFPQLSGEIAAKLPTLLSIAQECGLLKQLTEEASLVNQLPVPRPPLVLTKEGRFLYILRRRREEDELLQLLEGLCQGDALSSASLGLSQMTIDGPAGQLYQVLASGRRLALLAGGPGTGKTTTVATLLKALSQSRQQVGAPPFRVALAAPTGRAAARMMEGLAAAGVQEEGWRGRTLHGLLGLVPGQPPRHHQNHPIPADLVVVDEASMVDLPMMVTLLRALSPGASLLLVGDPDQLPSVEAGALLGDLLAGASQAAAQALPENPSPLAGSVVFLRKVYRSDTAILTAAAAVREGQVQDLDASLAAPGGVESSPLTNPEDMAQTMAQSYLEAVNLAQQGGEPESLFDAFGQIAVLSPLRRGFWGTDSLNQRVSRILSGDTQPFAGMPVMITANDAKRDLWNGDRGVVVTHHGRLRALFPGLDGPRYFSLAALPGYTPAWCQTIHKSQGSEFAHVLVLMPLAASSLLTREILYTALTRAKHGVQLYVEEGAVEAALARRVVRHSRVRHWASGLS
ncbi:MAG: exodeoxyribonuclease V subunit alpha [Spirochaetales bacterium]|nr:exodeoxyribonuclease V subunit alpha [Spirochaetales bacterium]